MVWLLIHDGIKLIRVNNGAPVITATFYRIYCEIVLTVYSIHGSYSTASFTGIRGFKYDSLNIMSGLIIDLALS